MGSLENPDLEEFPPPPPPEVFENANNEEDDDEGEKFDFDSGDDSPEADRQPLQKADEDLIDMGVILPHPPDKLLEDCGALLQDSSAQSDPSTAPKRVNPYSVIDIAPFQEGEPTSQESPTVEDSSSPRVPSGYSVPVPCGYAVPCNLPLLLPAYSTPIIIRNISVDEQGAQEEVSSPHLLMTDDNCTSEDFQAVKEDDVLAKWVSDPANTEWMESKYNGLCYLNTSDNYVFILTYFPRNLFFSYILPSS